MSVREIELLAPAANVEIAKEAILHGADAVYIGASSHGARKDAANSVDDIRDLCEYAHQWGVRIYVTVNTIIYEHELEKVEKLCWELYRAGVDALIVQDMALLRLNLPPIALHASTQCDTRTVEKAKFLEDVGMSQIVLARELTLKEIKDICDNVAVPVECFIHGALCVSYSGRCHASQHFFGRSANRGECAQVCRMKYTLTDADDNVLAKDKYLLSLKDFNQSENIEALLDAGVGSFKIEGRLKNAGYVKNITAHYRRLIDSIIAQNPDKYKRSSSGTTTLTFTPAPEKSFNRGFTHYFADGRQPISLASLNTPKSMGEVISSPAQINNGDGISYFNQRGEYVGFNVNKVEGNRIFSRKPVKLPPRVKLHRTYDVQWEKNIAKETAHRRIAVYFTIDPTSITARDERGCECCVSIELPKDKARRPQNPEKILAQLGTTIYTYAGCDNHLPEAQFVPNSIIAEARKRLVKLLDSCQKATYKFDKRREENLSAEYPYKKLDYRDNVANSLAEKFYKEHGVADIERAMECGGEVGKIAGKEVIMTTRHCVLRELGMCLKSEVKANIRPKMPLTLTSGTNIKMYLFPDCKKCENIFTTNDKK